jgi:hypothetical protein
MAPAVDAMRIVWNTRRERQWLGLVAVPLAMLATALSGMWWTWPLLLAGAWTVLHTWHWLWLLTLELAVIGAQWAILGAMALANSSANWLVIGLAWVAFPLALAIAGMANRHHHHQAMSQFPHGH